MSFNRYAALLGPACAACFAAAPAYAQVQSFAGVLTLDDAFARALAGAPVLRVADAARQASAASVRQADRGLNPTIDVMVENALGTGLYQGLDRTEGTLTFSQTIERGGDRAARTQLAMRQGERSRLQGEVAVQDLLLEVETSYIDAQRAAAERVVAEERLAIAREVAATVTRRVEAARDPLLAASRSQTQVAEAEIALETARLLEGAAKARLASFWGGALQFEVETASFNQATPLIPVNGRSAPEVEAAHAAEHEADAQVAVERARARPDPTLSAGVRYFNQDREAALVVGVSIPLGINDDNSGAVDRAAAESQRVRFETEALRRNVERQLSAASSQIEIAASEIAAIDGRLLPAAQEAVARARDGYMQGGFSYLDVLDAQRVLANARLQRISVLTSYHRARAALKRLQGGYPAAPGQ